MVLLCTPTLPRSIIVAAAVTTLVFGQWTARAFPPLNNTRLVVEDNGASCYYSDGVLTQGRGNKLAVEVGRARGLRTAAILCPRTNDRAEFYSEFSWPTNVLKRHHIGFPSPSPDHLVTFQEPPPNGTGLDPLRNIRGLALDNKLASLNSTATEMMPLVPLLRRYVTEEAMDRTGAVGANTINELREICVDVRSILQDRFNGSFGLLCDLVHSSCNGAIRSAHRAGWHFDTTSDETLVHSR
ncbi:hypothetical protein FOZ61_002950 [Perkinsus olseni]|uniref:Uncharacterized protein n=1 Tax=Perkinsus olseni TaxID=32597 RepID=A0A7J6LR23_PEROL|nr:hypothetical protein FOZ61_002950 [Perkinsus olseni]KAF4667283.1 hypothetical protein FOL46_002612 [Perkinsus olseni]